MEFMNTFGDLGVNGGVLPVETGAQQVEAASEYTPEPHQDGEEINNVSKQEQKNQLVTNSLPQSYVIEAPEGVQWGSDVHIDGKQLRLPDNGASTNLTVNEWSEGYGGSGDWGWSGGSGFDDIAGWDWGPGGNDWAGDGGGFNDNWVSDTQMQVVEIVGQRMTLWEKLEYDLNEMSIKVSSVVDNAIDAFKERGFVSAGFQNGFGVALTVDINHDVYVGVTAGRFGPSGMVGIGPEGVPISTHLSQWGVTAVTPIGVGMTGNDTGVGPVVGLPGFSVGYNQNISQAWRDGHRFEDIVGEASWYFREVYGLPR